MSVEQDLVKTVAPEHPIERTTSFKPYDVLIILDCGETTKLDKKLYDIISDQLTGCSDVHLHSLATAASAGKGEHVFVGYSGSKSTATAKQLAANGRGSYLKANAMNENELVVTEIKLETKVSRQLYPPSSDKPELRLVIDKSKDAMLTLQFRVIIPDYRTVFLTL